MIHLLSTNQKNPVDSFKDIHKSILGLYTLNEEEMSNHSSCIATLPPNWRISMPSCYSRKQIGVVSTIMVEMFVWCITTWNKGDFENE